MQGEPRRFMSSAEPDIGRQIIELDEPAAIGVKERVTVGNLP
jgi:hypothetical protein